VGLLAERFERVEPELVEEVGGSDELNPAEEAGVASAGRLDRRSADGKTAGDVPAAVVGWILVAAQLNGDRAGDPGPFEVEFKGIA
jgi:hypothetical protein